MSSLIVRFSTVQRFRVTPEAVAAAWVDPVFPAYLAEHHEMLESASGVVHVDRGATVERAVHYRPRPSVERLGPRTIPLDALAFVERSTFDRRTMRMTFEARSLRPRFAERVVHRGAATLRAAPGGTERRIETTLEVRDVPLALRALSGLAARTFEREAARLFDGEAQCLSSFLARVPRTAAHRGAHATGELG